MLHINQGFMIGNDARVKYQIVETFGAIELILPQYMASFETMFTSLTAKVQRALKMLINKSSFEI